MKFARDLVLIMGLGILGACASGSVQYQLVQDAQSTYKKAIQEYHALEDEYLVLLFNLERYPADSFLVASKKEMMRELEHLRSIMLHTRLEFDESVQQWDAEISGNIVERGQKVPTVNAEELRTPPQPRITPLPRVNQPNP